MDNATTTLTTRFPFAVTDESQRAEVNARIGMTLLTLEGLISELLDQTLGRDLNSHDREDVVQDLHLHLATRALPKFDADRGVLLTTFTYGVCRNFLHAHYRTKQRHPVPDTGIDGIDRAAPDRSNDDAVDRLAEEIIRDPNGILGGNDFTAAVVRAGADQDRLKQEMGGDRHKANRHRHKTIQRILRVADEKLM